MMDVQEALDRMPERDRELLCNMLRVDAVPPEVAEDYWRVKRLLDRVGAPFCVSTMADIAARHAMMDPRPQPRKPVIAPEPEEVCDSAPPTPAAEEPGLVGAEVRFFDASSGTFIEGTIRSISGDEDAEDCLCEVETDDGERVQKTLDELEVLSEN